MQIQVSIESRSNFLLAHDLLGRPTSLGVGKSYEAPGGAKIRLENLIERRDVSAIGALQFIVDLSTSVNIGLLSAWLYEKCSARGVKEIEVEGEKFVLTKEEVELRLSEELKKLDAKN